MKQDTTSKHARRGFAIMAGLFLAAIVVFNFDAVVDRFRGYIDVVAIVLETSGVRVGSAVSVEGMEAGRITAIDFVTLGDTGALALNLRLEDRVRGVLRVGSRAYTARERFIGEPSVRIVAGPADAPPLESGDTLYPLTQISIDELVDRGLEFAPALDSLALALSELERMAASRRPRIEGLVDRLAIATEEAGALRAELGRGAFGEWLADPTLRRRIDRLQERLAELSEAADGLGRYGDPELRSGVAELGRRAERLQSELAELEQRLAEGGGMVSRMRRDSAIAVAIAGVQAQIDSLRAEGMGFALRMFLP